MFLELVLFWVLGAVDWPQFRGPNSDAHVTGPATPSEWSDTKNVRWKINVPGLGWSSPVVVNERLFLTTAIPNGDGLSLRTMAYECATGKLAWEREVRAVDKAPQIHNKNSHASPTPIVSGDSVFVHFGTLGMARLSVDDGSIKWLCTDLIYPPQHGSGGSPVLAEGKLVVICDGSKNPFVAAVDAETGKVAWKTPRSVEARISHSFATPTLLTIDGKVQVLAPGPDHFAAYDISTGTELWRVKALGWSIVPQPALGHGLVIYNHDYDHPELLAIKLGGKGDVTDTHVAWKVKGGAPSTPSPLLVDESLYFVSDNGVASCVNVKSGERHWMTRLGGNYSASPVYANGKILFLSESGTATWVQHATEYMMLGQNEVPGRTFATPAFVGGAMYLRTDECLYKIAN